MTRHLIFLAVLVFTIAACSKSERPAPPLPGMFPSMADLCAAVVGAVQDSSVEKVKALCVTEQEYRDVIWANLDSSETSQAKMPVERAWSWVERDVDKAAGRYVSEFGKRDVRFIRLGDKKNVRTYPNMKVHRGQRIIVTVDGAEEEEWRLLNIVLEYKGWFKVIAYND